MKRLSLLLCAISLMLIGSISVNAQENTNAFFVNMNGVELTEALKHYRHQALHAAHIEFMHPIKGEMMSFDAPLPDDFTNLINLLREDEKVNGGKI